jgi:TRAP-type mannitol/chloroaromatic compound transport system permease small subunit
MEKIRKSLNIIDNICEWSGRIFSWFLISLVVLSIFEVFTRRILGEPTIWTHETLGYLFCASIFLTMGYTLRYKAHVNVDLFSRRLSPRGQAIVGIIGFVFFLGIFSTIFLWKGIEFAALSWARMERAITAFNFYVFPAKTLIPIGIFLLFIQGVANFLGNIVFLIKGEQL